MGSVMRIETERVEGCADPRRPSPLDQVQAFAEEVAPAFR